MAINAWWESDPIAEPFWMEITDREDVGADLHAPQTDGSGRDYWSYSLVRHVNEGDVVFHWWKPPGQEPAIIGYSRAVGSTQEGRIRWQAHGTVGRARGTAATTPSWRQPLADFVELDQKFTLSNVHAHEQGLRGLRDEEEQFHGGGPLYFPFALSDKRPPRAAQAYLVKLPRSVVREFNLPHEDIPEDGGAVVGTEQAIGSARPSRGAERRQVDPLVRRAIEKHAVRMVEEMLHADDWVTLDVGDTRPYDIEAMRGDETLHVEVKGSSTTDVLTIELTRGEVGHAQSEQTLLAVVEGIDWSGANGEVTTTGGVMRLWWDWEPDESNLVATVYRYTLPEVT